MRSVRLLLVLLAVSLASAAHAADKHYGVIAGFNFGTLSIEGTDGTDPRGSFAAGIVADYGFNDRFGIRVEPEFMSKGGKSTKRNPEWGDNDGAIFQLDCFNFPILARYDLATSAKRAYLLGGVGFSVGTEYKVEITKGEIKDTADLGDVFAAGDITLDLGLGISVPAGKDRMTFDGRVAFGLKDINQGGTIQIDGQPLVIPDISTHTLDFRLFATYLFAWGQ